MVISPDMAAADRLISRLNELDSVVDFTSTTTQLPQNVRDHALRGVAIQGLSTFELFVRERGLEWAAHLTNARIPATRLAGGTVSYSDRIVKTLPRRFQDLEDKDRHQLVDDLSQTLASFSTGSLVGHDLFFAWTGSNIQTSDIDEMVKLLGAERGWGDLTAIWKIVDPRFPGNTSAESTMRSFASLRHTMAHNADAPVDPISISAVTRSVRLIALLVDVCVSEAIACVCRGEPIPSKVGSTITVRAIRRDGKNWPETAPGVQRARRRHANLETALTEALLQARKHRGEIAVAYDGYEIVDWRAAV